MSTKNVRRSNKSKIDKATNNGLEIYQDDTDNDLYYKDNNGIIIKILNITDIPVAIAQDLESVLAVGNTTGINNISIDSSQNITWNEGVAGSRLTSLTTTSIQTWSLPNATGTIALTNNLQTEMSYASSDAITPLIVDTNIGGMFATHDMTVDSVFAGVSVVGTGPGITTIMLQKNGINMLTLPITIDSTEATSLTAATQPILPYTVIAKGDRISTNITAVTGNAAAGLQITLNGLRV